MSDGNQSNETRVRAAAKKEKKQTVIELCCACVWTRRCVKIDFSRKRLRQTGAVCVTLCAALSTVLVVVII